MAPMLGGQYIKTRSFRTGGIEILLIPLLPRAIPILRLSSSFGKNSKTASEQNRLHVSVARFCHSSAI